MLGSLRTRVFERCAMRGAWAIWAGAGALAVLGVVAGLGGGLTLLACAPLAGIVVLQVAYRREVAANQMRAQALVPSFERHLTGSKARWVLSGVASEPVVAFGGSQLVLVRDGRTRVRICLEDRDQHTEQVLVATAAADAVSVETFRWGQVQDARRVAPRDFYTTS